MLFSREVLCSVRLARILNHNQVVSRRKFENCIDVRHLPVQMNGNDRSDGHSRLAVYYHSSDTVEAASSFQVLLKLSCIQVISALVDVDEVRTRACLGNRLRGCDKGIR